MRNSIIAIVLGGASMALCTATAGAAEDPSYQDGQGGAVVLPQGDRSFADRVVDYRPGSGKIEASARDPEATLGPPDFSGNVDDGSFVSLGCDGVLDLEFTDNAIVDVPGPDLYVFEVGPQVEGMSLAISEDGEQWIEIGEIGGGRAEVDIAPFIQAGQDFRFVRLTDDGIGCGTRFAGADVDSVAAMGSALRFVLSGEVMFALDSAELRPEAKVELDRLADEIAASNVTAFQVVGHSDSTGNSAHNLTLSQQRAQAVGDYLAGKEPLAGVEISTEGRGDGSPIASNETAEGRQKNRRVEIVSK
ncbi:OmpA family protein [Luteimonas sp. MJ204]|uniref:OmpA family protein n=1 Tax=Luteimonas sp. MJ145 TaxID=3129234 RepID=UPI0031BB3A58